MVLKFTLRMPNCGSWNGRWSGDERSHTVCKTFRRRSDIEKYEKLDKHYFIHDFGDGWRASVRVDIVTAAEAQKARKNSAGFAGYDWLIKNILSGKMKGMKIRD
ncbi:MAG: hypothetical protein EGS42_13570 [Coprococcus eutactus]|jgi:hypothetical protein|nr:hypothetical protein [Coprococcus eutactus]NSJ89011.1 hypothetical protein [Coprococcus sp. MSK.21.13]